ncbi:MAG: TonB-dependent receptor [Pseudomonadales bacterium]
MPYALTRFVRGVVVAALLLPFSNVVLAEEAGTRRIEEVIVTAERKEASIQDTSISISAFTDQFLDDFGIRNQEDLQNFVPATTIQPYDATVRGVGRNFRALGGDPGVSTYMNGVYSEDLLTATAATFWDVERIEVLRGPQGTLYGRNAVGGAINILYKEPTDEFEGAVKGILGNFDSQEIYGAVSGPLIKGQLSGRVNFAHRERDGMVEEIGDGPDLDSLGTDNVAVLLKWTPIDSVEFNIRHNWMDINRVFGGANGGGLVVLNEEGQPFRNTTNLVPGYRRIDTNNTAAGNFFQNNWYDQSQPILNFTDPQTGENVQAQHNRAGIDYYDGAGAQHAAASLDGFNSTSAATAARYNDCVFPGKIKGDDVCAATNGHNWEEFEQEGTQFNVAWDVTDSLQLKYLYGHSELSYERITDDDNTASMVHDRQFYVNHEARYESHELQAFYDIGDNFTVTSGIFFYYASINQRGDFYSSVQESRYRDPYTDNTGIYGVLPSVMVDLYSAKRSCTQSTSPAETCERNYAVNNTAEDLGSGFVPGATRNDNLQLSIWGGDDGTNRALDVIHGPRTAATDLLYATETVRDAFAAYTQAVWDISEAFTLTMGIRYAEDEVEAEENLFRYTESTLNGADALFANAVVPGSGIANINIINNGINPATGAPVQDVHTQGGWPIAVSVYRPFKRKDDDITWRVNLDWDINDSAMMYFNVTTGYRSGGYNLLYMSNTPTYDPEDLTAYEIGYKTQWLDDRLQINGSFYYYDYENIHTVATEVTSFGGTTLSVLAAPGAEIYGIEAEATWLVTDRITLGSNFSWTPSEYTKSFLIRDPTGVETPESIFPEQAELLTDIKGNQLLQVPEGKATAWASYRFPLQGGASLDISGVYSWISEVYYSPFESETEKADAYDRTDLRATFTSGGGNWIISAFVNNVFDDVGVLQILNEAEDEFFRHTAGTTVPRHYGLEVTFQTGRY